MYIYICINVSLVSYRIGRPGELSENVAGGVATPGALGAVGVRIHVACSMGTGALANATVVSILKMLGIRLQNAIQVNECLLLYIYRLYVYIYIYVQPI